jgi:uncharacterized ParB-like nuclease family protein
MAEGERILEVSKWKLARDKAFIADTLTMYRKVGIRKTAAGIRLDIEIGEKVIGPVSDKITGTHLDNLPYLTKLKDLPWSEQLALVETDLTEMSETNKSQRSEDRRISKICNKLYRTTEALRVEDVYIYGDRRALRNETISELAESMDRIGLRSPISVRIIPVNEGSGDYYLVTGAHRLAAAKKLGWEFIECFVVENESDDQAKLWEIAENLHRAELTVLERSKHIAEWVRITNKLSQVGTVSKGGRGNEGGINKAERDLGLGHNEAHRAIKIAGLTPEAKKVAVEVGLDDNASALLAAKDKSGDATKEIANLRAERARKDAWKHRHDGERNKPPVLAKSYSETAKSYFEPQEAKLGPIGACESNAALPIDLAEIKGGLATLRSLETRLGRFCMTDFNEAITLAKSTLERRLAA